MEIHGNNPFIPLTLRGRFKESTYFKRDIYREGVVLHLGIWVSFVIWILTFGICLVFGAWSRLNRDGAERL